MAKERAKGETLRRLGKRKINNPVKVIGGRRARKSASCSFSRRPSQKKTKKKTQQQYKNKATVLTYLIYITLHQQPRNPTLAWNVITTIFTCSRKDLCTHCATPVKIPKIATEI
jgi:hypothetical protein